MQLLEEVLETVSPVLPVVIISVSEGRKVLPGRQTFQVALKESLERALKSGVGDRDQKYYLPY